jgi:hypothetical protein
MPWRLALALPLALALLSPWRLAFRLAVTFALRRALDTAIGCVADPLDCRGAGGVVSSALL